MNPQHPGIQSSVEKDTERKKGNLIEKIYDSGIFVADKLISRGRRHEETVEMWGADKRIGVVLVVC